LRIFAERQVFPISHDAHDLDRQAGVEELLGELLIHDGNSLRLRGVGKAYIESREQWCSSGGKYPGDTSKR
jgi:hypothetical protein